MAVFSIVVRVKISKKLLYFKQDKLIFIIPAINMVIGIDRDGIFNYDGYMRDYIEKYLKFAEQASREKIKKHVERENELGNRIKELEAEILELKLH